MTPPDDHRFSSDTPRQDNSGDWANSITMVVIGLTELKMDQRRDVLNQYPELVGKFRHDSTSYIMRSQEALNGLITFIDVSLSPF
jgi:hypothetical protein